MNDPTVRDCRAPAYNRALVLRRSTPLRILSFRCEKASLVACVPFRMLCYALFSWNKNVETVVTYNGHSDVQRSEGRSGLMEKLLRQIKTLTWLYNWRINRAKIARLQSYR
jgi:hypothetical protein